jgi:hypothetical protein
MDSHRLHGDFSPEARYDGVRQPLCFAHRVTANGLIISTCSACLKMLASPNPSQLRMAEAVHICVKHCGD